MSEFLTDDPASEFRKGRGRKPKELKPWQAKEGEKVVARQRCWNDPLGCEKYVMPEDMKWHRHLCNACVQKLCEAYGMPVTDVDFLVVLMHQDRGLAISARLMGASEEKIRDLHKSRHNRPRQNLAAVRLGKNNDEMIAVNRKYRQWYYDQVGVAKSKSRAKGSGLEELIR